MAPTQITRRTESEPRPQHARGAAATSDLEEIEGLHGSIVQPHVLAEVEIRQPKGAKAGLVREELQVADDGGQGRHGDLRGAPPLLGASESIAPVSPNCTPGPELTCFSISGRAELDTVSPLRACNRRSRSCTTSLVVNSTFFLSDTRTPPRCTTWQTRHWLSDTLA